MRPRKLTEKELALRVVRNQPDDCTLEKLADESRFHAMVLRGLADSDAGRVFTSEQIKRTIESWRR